ncbi:MAG: hypothetical protein HC806_02695 [Anaerolineae bacterium]|nr:hypothetical protein [Anaerolineae bacterium]
MSGENPSPLEILPQLRELLPTELVEKLETAPTDATLERVFNHLRTLYHILDDYLPRRIATRPPQPGQIGHSWQEGTLIFTDLIGFTALMDANNRFGQEGAETLLEILNNYFREMIESSANLPATCLNLPEMPCSSCSQKTEAGRMWSGRFGRG